MSSSHSIHITEGDDVEQVITSLYDFMLFTIALIMIKEGDSVESMCKRVGLDGYRQVWELIMMGRDHPLCTQRSLLMLNAISIRLSKYVPVKIYKKIPEGWTGCVGHQKNVAASSCHRVDIIKVEDKKKKEEQGPIPMKSVAIWGNKSGECEEWTVPSVEALSNPEKYLTEEEKILVLPKIVEKVGQMNALAAAAMKVDMPI